MQIPPRIAGIFLFPMSESTDTTAIKYPCPHLDSMCSHPMCFCDFPGSMDSSFCWPNIWGDEVVYCPRNMSSSPSGGSWKKKHSCCLTPDNAGGWCCRLESLMDCAMIFPTHRRQRRELGGKKTMPSSKCDTTNYCATALG